MNPATAPEVRLTAHIYERVYGGPPATTRHIRGALPLLDGLHVPLPWGTVVAAGPSGSSSSLYSMNHHADGVVAPSDARDWARECLTALDAYPTSGTRIVVNRELPAKTGLLTGAETIRATALALRDLHGTASENPAPPSPRLTCNLSRTGLRMVIIDVGARRPPAIPPGDPAAARRAASAIVKGRPADLGPLLTDAHTRGDPVHDNALEAALEAGALGGRTIGACMVTLTPVTAVLPVRHRVTARLTSVLPRPPRYLTV